MKSIGHLRTTHSSLNKVFVNLKDSTILLKLLPIILATSPKEESQLIMMQRVLKGMPRKLLGMLTLLLMQP